MDDLIDRRGCRSHFLFLQHKTFKIKSRVLVNSIPWLRIVKNGKNGQVHKAGKVRSSSATPTKLFSVDSCDLKFMSFKFGNDIFIAFEMPRSSYQMIFWKNPFLCFSVHL